MAKLRTLKDGLIEQLKDIYNAENQLLKVLPKMGKKAANQKLKGALHAHLLETEGQVERLDEIATQMDVKLTGKTCMAMQGLLKEANDVLEQESQNEALIDALLIGAAQRIEHYEIASYGTARAMAEVLGEEEIVDLLSVTLNEEKDADKKLSAISEGQILPKANLSDDDMDEDVVPSKKSKSTRPPSMNKSGNAARTFALIGCLFFAHQGSSLANADTTATDRLQNERKASYYEGDNTGRNMRDRNLSRTTADDQNLTGNDTEILARIRREIVANDNLSINGQNVKILVENGVVKLRGPVESLQEKNWIEETTAKVVPTLRVISQLEVVSE